MVCFKKINNWAIFILFCAFFGFQNAARATDYYTAKTGNDYNTGSITDPFYSITKGISKLSAGDTLYVRGGTYNESFVNYGQFAAGSSWDIPVFIKAYSGEQVTIKPNSGAEFAFRFVQTQYVVIDGFSIDASNVKYDAIKITYGTAAYGAQHIRIENCEIMNAPGQGILVDSEGNNGGYNQFLYLDIHNNGNNDHDHGIYINNDYNLVKYCKIHDNSGWGVHIYNGYPGQTADYNTIENNEIYQNPRNGFTNGANIGVYSGTGNVINNNMLHNSKIGIQANWGAQYCTISNNKIYNNKQSGIEIGPYTTNISLTGNTIYNNQYDGIMVYNGSKNDIIANNYVYNNGYSYTNNINDYAGSALSNNQTWE